MTKYVVLKASIGGSAMWNKSGDNKQINMIIRKEGSDEDIYYVTTADKIININTKKSFINDTNIDEILSEMQESIKNKSLKCLLDNRGYMYFNYYENDEDIETPASPEKDQKLLDEKNPVADDVYDTGDNYVTEISDYDHDNEEDGEIIIDNDVDYEHIIIDNKISGEDMLIAASKILRDDIQSNVEQRNKSKNIAESIYEFIKEMPPLRVTIYASNADQYSPLKISTELKGYLIYYFNNYVKKYLLEIYSQESKIIDKVIKNIIDSIEQKNKNEIDLQLLIKSLSLTKKIMSIQFSEDYLKKEGHKRASIYILDTIFTCNKEVTMPLVRYITE